MKSNLAVDQVAAALHLLVEGRLAGGEHGAYAVRSEDGSPLVLKVFPGNREQVVTIGVSIASRLQAQGALIPDPYEVGRAAGRVFTLQRRCRGVTPNRGENRIELCHAEQILGLWERFRGACPEGGDWPESVQRALVTGDADLWAVHRHLREGADREALTGDGIAARAAAQLLEEVIAVGEEMNTGALARTDAVHRDFHHANVLIDGKEVTAVVDWEAARPGDARYDLVSLACWSEVQRTCEVSEAAADRIATYVEATVPQQARRSLSALYGLHQLWYSTVHRPSDLPQIVGMVAAHLAPHWRG